MKRYLSFCAAVVAAVSAHAETRELGAHEHGHGALNIAVENDAVLMELEVPGADIVGFEHPAKSAEDRAAVDAAIAMLEKPLELFKPDAAAGCMVSAAKVTLLTEGEDNGEHGHDEHDKHDGDGHGHEDHADEEDGGHTEFHAEYALNCANPAALRSLDFAYFALFPNAEELAVQLISDKGAKGFEAERAAPRLDLSGAI